MFQQIIDPFHNLFLTWLVALIPLALLLVLLAVFRWSAWTATLVGSLVTLLLGWTVWKMPIGRNVHAYLHGSATGVWNVDRITFWGVVLFNTLVVTGAFARFQRWISFHGTRDVRVQTILFAWAFGALLEGLVGFGYPWAVVAPILIALGMPDLDAIYAAIANNAPVSYALSAHRSSHWPPSPGSRFWPYPDPSPTSSPFLHFCRLGSLSTSSAASAVFVKAGRWPWWVRSGTSRDSIRSRSISVRTCPISPARSSA